MRILPVLCLAFATVTACADDWLNFRGPSNNGISKESGWKTSPSKAWETKVGTGASSVVVVGNRLLTMGNQQDKDVVWCLDTTSGKVLWKHEYSSKFDQRMFDGGTASTPTIDGDKVYTLSYLGELFCLNLKDGKVVWKKNVVSEFGGSTPRWKFACSPLIDGNVLVVDIGGKGNSTLALDKRNGKKLWGAGSDNAGYSTPIPYDLAGKRNVLVFKGTAMVSLDMRSGRENWRIPWKTSYDVNASSPTVAGKAMLISSGYGDGRAVMYNLGTGGKPKQVWRNDDMKTKMSSCVVYKGKVYGISQSRKGQLMCIDGRTGKTEWTSRGFGFGTLTVAGDKIVALTEGGELVIAQAAGGAYKELSRTRAVSRRCWVNVVLANGRIYCKNNTGDLACFSVK